MKAKSITQVDLTMSGEEADLLIEFILKFARQRPIKESDQLLRIAQELNDVRRLMPKNVIDAEFV